MDDTSPCRALCINLRLLNTPSGQTNTDPVGHCVLMLDSLMPPSGQTNTEDPVGHCVLTLDSLMPRVVKQIQKIL
jgi:hypothetical protein